MYYGGYLYQPLSLFCIYLAIYISLILIYILYLILFPSSRSAGKPLRLTVDHNVSNATEEELKRIKDKEGVILYKKVGGTIYYLLLYLQSILLSIIPIR